MKIFLGGTCNESTWRDELINLLSDDVDYFNPVVDDWTPAHQENELLQKTICSHCLYVITPLMTGVYSIAEVVDDSNKSPDRTLFCILTEDGEKKFTGGQYRSLIAVSDMVKRNGSRLFSALADVAVFCNGV